MKFKVGDKVKISVPARWSSSDKKRFNGKIGTITRMPNISGWYKVDNESLWAEGELELVPNFGVGDKVKIVGNRGDMCSSWEDKEGIISDSGILGGWNVRILEPAILVYEDEMEKV